MDVGVGDQVLSTWHQVLSMWYQVLGTWYQVLSSWYSVLTEFTQGELFPISFAKLLNEFVY